MPIAYIRINKLNLYFFMKNHLIPALVFFVIVLSNHTLSAQDLPEKRNEIGLDISRIFPFGGNNNIMYRRHGENGAFRATATFGGGITQHEESPENSHNFNFSLALGHQFNKRFDKWNFYFGGDIFGEISRSKSARVEYWTGEPFTFINEYDRNSFGLRPIIGISYMLSPRVSFTFENALNIQYNMNNELQVNQSRTTERKSNSYSAAYNPLNVLMISFHY